MVTVLWLLAVAFALGSCQIPCYISPDPSLDSTGSGSVATDPVFSLYRCQQLLGQSLHIFALPGTYSLGQEWNILFSDLTVTGSDGTIIDGLGVPATSGMASVSNKLVIENVIFRNMANQGTEGLILGSPVELRDVLFENCGNSELNNFLVSRGVEMFVAERVDVRNAVALHFFCLRGHASVHDVQIEGFSGTAVFSHDVETFRATDLPVAEYNDVTVTISGPRIVQTFNRGTSHTITFNNLVTVSTDVSAVCDTPGDRLYFVSCQLEGFHMFGKFVSFLDTIVSDSTATVWNTAVLQVEMVEAQSSMFSRLGGADVNRPAMQMTNGSITDCQFEGNGIGPWQGGAASDVTASYSGVDPNLGHVTISYCHFSGGVSEGASLISHSQAVITVIDSTFTSPVPIARSYATTALILANAAIYFHGCVFHNNALDFSSSTSSLFLVGLYGTLSISDSLITNNSAVSGIGAPILIHGTGSIVNITRTTFSNNHDMPVAVIQDDAQATYTDITIIGADLSDVLDCSCSALFIGLSSGAHWLRFTGTLTMTFVRAYEGIALFSVDLETHQGGGVEFTHANVVTNGVLKLSNHPKVILDHTTFTDTRIELYDSPGYVSSSLFLESSVFALLITKEFLTLEQTTIRNSVFNGSTESWDTDVPSYRAGALDIVSLFATSVANVAVESCIFNKPTAAMLGGLFYAQNALIGFTMSEVNSPTALIGSWFAAVDSTVMFDTTDVRLSDAFSNSTIHCQNSLVFIYQYVLDLLPQPVAMSELFTCSAPSLSVEPVVLNIPVGLFVTSSGYTGSLCGSFFMPCASIAEVSKLAASTLEPSYGGFLNVYVMGNNWGSLVSPAGTLPFPYPTRLRTFPLVRSGFNCMGSPYPLIIGDTLEISSLTFNNCPTLDFANVTGLTVYRSSLRSGCEISLQDCQDDLLRDTVMSDSTMHLQGTCRAEHSGSLDNSVISFGSDAETAPFLHSVESSIQGLRVSGTGAWKCTHCRIAESMTVSSGASVALIDSNVDSVSYVVSSGASASVTDSNVDTSSFFVSSDASATFLNSSIGNVSMVVSRGASVSLVDSSISSAIGVQVFGGQLSLERVTTVDLSVYVEGGSLNILGFASESYQCPQVVCVDSFVTVELNFTDCALAQCSNCSISGTWHCPNEMVMTIISATTVVAAATLALYMLAAPVTSTSAVSSSGYSLLVDNSAPQAFQSRQPSSASAQNAPTATSRTSYLQQIESCSSVLPLLSIQLIDHFLNLRLAPPWMLFRFISALGPLVGFFAASPEWISAFSRGVDISDAASPASSDAALFPLRVAVSATRVAQASSFLLFVVGLAAVVLLVSWLMSILFRKCCTPESVGAKIKSFVILTLCPALLFTLLLTFHFSFAVASAAYFYLLPTVIGSLVALVVVFVCISFVLFAIFFVAKPDSISISGLAKARESFCQYVDPEDSPWFAPLLPVMRSLVLIMVFLLLPVAWLQIVLMVAIYTMYGLASLKLTYKSKVQAFAEAVTSFLLVAVSLCFFAFIDTAHWLYYPVGWVAFALLCVVALLQIAILVAKTCVALQRFLKKVLEALSRCGKAKETSSRPVSVMIPQDNPLFAQFGAEEAEQARGTRRHRRFAESKYAHLNEEELAAMRHVKREVTRFDHIAAQEQHLASVTPEFEVEDQL